MNLFYSPDINSDTIHYTLSEEESGHAIRVLRMKIDNTIFSTDGKGFFYKGTIVNDHPKKCLVKIINKIEDTAKRKFNLSIAIAPTKMIDRFEWFLEKATEIGCDEIIPIQCHHSERTIIKPERLNKVLVSAMKQCLKSQLPVIKDMIDLKKFILTSENYSGQKFIGHIPELSDSEFPPKHPEGILLTKAYSKEKNALIIIGPEGGFSEEEINLAISKNITPISLGNSRLRVETAGIMACAIINSLNH